MGFAVLHAAGGLGLFLFGMLAMTDGLKSLTGSWLARVLARFTQTPASGALTGAATTALVQSSSATTVAAVGFVGAGILTFSQALGVIFGANVGTTLTGWIVVALGFRVDLDLVAPLFVLAGVLLRLFGRRRATAVGGALAGFGLVFVGIDVLQHGMAAFEGAVTPESFPPDTWWGRGQLLFLGVLLTIVTQSSSAGVAAALTAVHAGALTLPQAAAMVVGMDVGTTATAALSTIGGSVAARRTGWAHVVYNGMTGVCAFLLVPVYVAAAERLAGGALARDPGLALVLFHTAFNVAGVIVVLPLTRRFAELIVRLVPEEPGAVSIALDRALLKEPALAVEAATGATRRLADGMLRATARSLGVSAAAGGAVRPMEEEISGVLSFLADLETGAEQGPLHDRHVALMHVIDHLDRLVERMHARRREDDPGGDELQERARTLGADVLRFARRFEEPPDDVTEAISAAAFDEHARALRAFEVEVRQSTLRDAASGALHDDVALGRLDEARRLWRIAEHVAAITRHGDVIAAR